MLHQCYRPWLFREIEVTGKLSNFHTVNMHCATCILLAEKAGRVMGLQGLQRPLNQRMPHIGDGTIYRIPKHLTNAVHTVEISGFS